MAIQLFRTADVLTDEIAEVGEGPLFDPRSGRLSWVDLSLGIHHVTDPGTGLTTSQPVGTMLGAAVPRADDPGYAVVVKDGFGYLDQRGVTMIDAVTAGKSQRMNDAKCDERGRLWATSTGMDHEPGAGEVRVWEGGHSRSAARGWSLPNGIGWSPDSTRIYVADSVSQVLMTADFSLDDGHVGAFQIFATFETGMPDGLCVDGEGAVWVAVWGNGAIHRYAPNGALVGLVELPVSQPTSCAFAPDGTLYITSASAGLDSAERWREPHAGKVFAMSTSLPALPVSLFRPLH